MRRTPLIAATLALALTAGAARADDPTTIDVRCIIVAGNLAQNDDPDLKKLGTVSLIYFWGRLEGRGATTNVDSRVVEEAKKMTADDFKTQAQTCGAMVSAAGDSLQALANAVQQRLGGAAPAK